MLLSKKTTSPPKLDPKHNTIHPTRTMKLCRSFVLKSWTGSVRLVTQEVLTETWSSGTWRRCGHKPPWTAWNETCYGSLLGPVEQSSPDRGVCCSEHGGVTCCSSVKTPAEARASIDWRGGASDLAGNLNLICRTLTRQYAGKHGTGPGPAAGHQLLHVLPRLFGHIETHPCFQRPLHQSQVVRNRHEQNIQTGSVSHWTVRPLMCFPFTLSSWQSLCSFPAIILAFVSLPGHVCLQPRVSRSHQWDSLPHHPLLLHPSAFPQLLIGRSVPGLPSRWGGSADVLCFSSHVECSGPCSSDPCWCCVLLSSCSWSVPCWPSAAWSSWASPTMCWTCAGDTSSCSPPLPRCPCSWSISPTLARRSSWCPSPSEPCSACTWIWVSCAVVCRTFKVTTCPFSPWSTCPNSSWRSWRCSQWILTDLSVGWYYKSLSQTYQYRHLSTDVSIMHKHVYLVHSGSIYLVTMYFLFIYGYVL